MVSISVTKYIPLDDPKLERILEYSVLDTLLEEGYKIMVENGIDIERIEIAVEKDFLKHFQPTYAAEGGIQLIVPIASENGITKYMVDLRIDERKNIGGKEFVILRFKTFGQPPQLARELRRKVLEHLIAMTKNVKELRGYKGFLVTTVFTPESALGKRVALIENPYT